MLSKRAANIVFAAGTDGVGYVCGLPWLGTAAAVAQAYGSRLIPNGHVLRASSYLDWELRNWRELYRGEAPLVFTCRGERLALPQVLALDNTDGRRASGDIRIRLDRGTFALDEEVRARTEDAFRWYRRRLIAGRRSYANAMNIRLCGIDAGTPVATLVVQPVCYEDYLRTNLCLDADLRGQGITLRGQLHAEGRLEPLNASRLANTLGINTLLFTADGRLLVPMRSRAVIVRPGEYCPSASGTVTYTDVLRAEMQLAELPSLREAYEEVGLSPDDVPEPSVRFLGITRELIRGGQPEMFFVASTRRSADECRRLWADASDRFESRRIEFFDFGPLAQGPLDTPPAREKFVRLFDQCVDRFEPRMSVPLWTALALWKRARIGAG